MVRKQITSFFMLHTKLMKAMKHVVRRCCGSQNTFLAPPCLNGEGTSAKQAEHKAQYAGSTKEGMAGWREKGWGGTLLQGPLPGPHLPSLGSPHLWMVSPHFKMPHKQVPPLLRPVDTTNIYHIPQHTRLYKTAPFLLVFSLPSDVTLHVPGSYAVSPSPALVLPRLLAGLPGHKGQTDSS